MNNIGYKRSMVLSFYEIYIHNYDEFDKIKTSFGKNLQCRSPCHESINEIFRQK